MSANIKSKRVAPDRGTNHLGSQFVKNSEYVEGTSSSYISKYDIVVINGADGAYQTVERAEDGGTKETYLAVAVQQIRDFGAIGAWAVETDVDTSGATAVEDPIYLSDATPGAWTVTAPVGAPIIVGKVLVKHATEGVVLIKPLV